MSAPKHTPGPWSVAQSFRPGAQFTIRATLGKSTPFVVAETACLHPTWGDELANAALIASAPELAARIAALESLLTKKQRQVDLLTDRVAALTDAVEEALTWRGTDITCEKLRAALKHNADCELGDNWKECPACKDASI